MGNIRNLPKCKEFSQRAILLSSTTAGFNIFMWRRSEAYNRGHGMGTCISSFCSLFCPETRPFCLNLDYQFFTGVQAWSIWISAIPEAAIIWCCCSRIGIHWVWLVLAVALRILADTGCVWSLSNWSKLLSEVKHIRLTSALKIQ